MVAVEPMGVGGPPRPKRMTDEEWANLPEDEEGELVDGLLVEEEVADLRHELAVSWLVKVLSNWADPLGGFVTASELKYILRPGRGRKPDVSMLLPGRKHPRDRGVLRRPLDVLIEVVSPTPRDARRDRFEKFSEYAAFGAKYYWIVDPALRTFEFYELNEQGRYTQMRAADSGKVDNIPGCEGLMLDLDELWARLDQFTTEEDIPSNDPADQADG
jgi:Uma2 family endonuclease